MLRRQYCREKLYLPAKYNYYHNMVDAYWDEQSYKSHDDAAHTCPYMYSVEEAFPYPEEIATELLSPPPFVVQAPPPPSPMPPGVTDSHAASMGALVPASPPSPDLPPHPPVSLGAVA